MNQISQKKALFVNTSSERARVVLIVGDRIVKNIKWPVGFGAGKEILEKISEMLKESNIELDEIDRVAVHVGPARKSSILRAGVTVAAFLSYASGAELVAVEGNEEDELVDEVFAASPQSVIKLNYDRLGVGGGIRKA